VLTQTLSVASQTWFGPQSSFASHGRNSAPSGATVMFWHVCAELLSSRHWQIAVLPQAVPRFWQVVPLESLDGVDGAGVAQVSRQTLSRASQTCPSGQLALVWQNSNPRSLGGSTTF
jgi:hypothetical protein